MWQFSVNDDSFWFFLELLSEYALFLAVVGATLNSFHTELNRAFAPASCFDLLH